MPTIPEPIKRIVRQESGFGCCKCGKPIYQYHHIVRKSEDPQNIMLLCPDHHTEATEKAMLEKEQRFHREHPYNIKNGFVEGQLKVNQETPVLIIGGNEFVGNGDFFIVDNESLLSVEIYEGKLELSVKLYDKNDNLVAKVERNEWVSGDALPWDIESRYQWLKIRRKIGDVQLEIDARKFPIEITADIWKNGNSFQISSNDLIFNGLSGRLQNIGFYKCQIGGVFKVDTLKNTMTIGPRVPKERIKVES